MSFDHYAYFFDWAAYERRIGGQRLDPERLADWQEPLDGVRRRAGSRRPNSLPRWKRNLLERLEARGKALLSGRARLSSLKQVRDLHFAGLVECCVSRAEGLEWYAFMVEEPLKRILGAETADLLVHGRLWSGSAWDFMTILNYHFGFLLPDEMARWRQELRRVPPELFRKTLREVDWTGVYPVHRPAMNDEEEDWALDALNRLKSNVDKAHARGLGLFYILD